MTDLERKAMEKIVFRTEPCSITGFSILIGERAGRDVCRVQLLDEVITELLAGSKEGQREAFEAGYDVGLADAFINDRTSKYYRGRVDGLTDYLSQTGKGVNL